MPIPIRIAMNAFMSSRVIGCRASSWTCAFGCSSRYSLSSKYCSEPFLCVRAPGHLCQKVGGSSQLESAHSSQPLLLGYQRKGLGQKWRSYQRQEEELGVDEEELPEAGGEVEGLGADEELPEAGGGAVELGAVDEELPQEGAV